MDCFDGGLELGVCGASAVAVEIVAALTVVTASGVTRGWRSAIEGTIAAVVLLAPLEEVSFTVGQAMSLRPSSGALGSGSVAP